MTIRFPAGFEIIGFDICGIYLTDRLIERSMDRN